LLSSYDCRKTPTDGLAKTKQDVVPSKIKGRDDQGPDRAEEKGKFVPPHQHVITSAWCQNCDEDHEQDVASCPLRSPVRVVADAALDFLEDEDGSACLDLSRSFAQLTLPSILTLAEAGSGVKVAAGEVVEERTQLGPLKGEAMLERDVPEDFDMKDLWQIFAEDGGRHYVSTVNAEKSNWMRYLRPAEERGERNLAAVVKGEKLFFVTTKSLEEGEELLFWIDDPDLMWTKKRAEKKSKTTFTTD